MLNWFLLLLFLFALGAWLYWALVITEGVYLGRRLVVWLYDKTATRYDEIKAYDPATEMLFVVKPFLYRLRHIPAPRILDVATGTGRVPLFVLEDPYFHGKLTAVDASAQMLAQAQSKLRGAENRVFWVQGTAVGLTFPPHTFDAVSCLESLEFFPDQKLALQEMARVLRPEGVLMVTRRRGWEAKLFVGRYYSEDDFEQILQQVGFVQVEILPWQVDYDLVFAIKA